MLEILIAALSQTPAVPQPELRAVPERQAQASVRIMRADPIRLGEETRPGGASVLRNTQLRESDGSTRPASLIEFY